MKFRGRTTASSRNHQTYRSPLKALPTACALILALAVIAPHPAAAQTFSVIYNFASGPLGANPFASLVMDRDGNLYGTTANGGAGTCPSFFDYGPTGCGTVFKFNPSTGRFTVLYEFTGGTDGATPFAPLLIAPDGTLYGSTTAGGDDSCSGSPPGCGVIFHLQPRPTPPRNVLENYWIETPIYSFQGSPDGQYPVGDLAMDQSGDIYGSTELGGTINSGVVFELTSSNGSWSESIPHGFLCNSGDGCEPTGGVTLYAGDIYGGAGGGAHANGTVYQLVPTGSGWMENLLYSFTGGSDGSGPGSGVTFDSSGNLYSSTYSGGSDNGGTVFELSPPGVWTTFRLLYTFTEVANGNGGPLHSDLIMDQAGNLYGTTFFDGAYGEGAVFKLTPTMGGYTYTSLHDFCSGAGCSDGYEPAGTLVMDSSGNLYGTASGGGSPLGACDSGGYGNCGVIFKITP